MSLSNLDCKAEKDVNLSNAPTQGLVVTTAIIGEGVLLAIAFFVLWWQDISLQGSYTYTYLIAGVGAAFPLLFINLCVIEELSNYKRFAIYNKFKRELIQPLCANLSPPSILVIALCSGIGEEIFFRGMLNPLLASLLTETSGIMLGSFAFAYIHFISMAKTYWKLIVIYFLFGLYFSYLYLYTDNIITCILTHATYNFFAMLYVHYIETPQSS